MVDTAPPVVIDRYPASAVPEDLRGRLLELTLPNGDMAKVFRACSRGTRQWVGQVLVARDGERVVGWALRWRSDFHIGRWVLHLFVHPDRRRQGIGAALVDSARHRLRDSTVLHGCVWDDTSRAFWEKQVATRDRVVAPGLRRKSA